HTHTHTHTNKHTRTRSTTYVCHHPSVCSYHLLLPLLTSFFFLSFLPLSLSLLLFYLNPSNPFALHSSQTPHHTHTTHTHPHPPTHTHQHTHTHKFLCIHTHNHIHKHQSMVITHVE